MGPAFQSIELDSNSGGKLVSRVKVSTIGGAASSIMTTKATIMNEGYDLDKTKIQVDTTKPEDSSVLKKLGMLGQMIAESSPPFPSGEALERVARGSSIVEMTTIFCDATMRISYYDNNTNKKFVWKRTAFRGSSEI